MESPCILVCSLDTTTGYCVGCGRTGDEIGAWTLYSAQQRRVLMDTLPARMETMDRLPERTERHLLAHQRAAAE